MGYVSRSFYLDSDRVNRLNKAGVLSLADLLKVLAALDLVAIVQLEVLRTEEVSDAHP